MSIHELKRKSEIFRPTRLAVVHGSKIDGATLKLSDIHDCFSQMKSRLHADVFSVSQAENLIGNDSSFFENYDLIALIGEPGEFRTLARNEKRSINAVTLSFAPKARSSEAKSYLWSSDAVILCEAKKKNWLPEVSSVTFNFFENLAVPSLLNVDIADVKRIAKGVGMVLSFSNDDHEKLVGMLPKECLTAKSAILHFSCADDVSLNEIYSISKSVTLNRGIDRADPRITLHAEAKRLIRNVNVKLGIRVIGKVRSGYAKRRINLTAILFEFSE